MNTVIIPSYHEAYSAIQNISIYDSVLLPKIESHIIPKKDERITDINSNFNKTCSFFEYMLDNKNKLNFEFSYVEHEDINYYGFKFKIKKRIFPLRFRFTKEYFYDLILKENKNSFDCVYEDILHILNIYLKGSRILYKNLYFLTDYLNPIPLDEIYEKQICFCSVKVF